MLGREPQQHPFLVRLDSIKREPHHVMAIVGVGPDATGLDRDAVRTIGERQVLHLTLVPRLLGQHAHPARGKIDHAARVTNQVRHARPFILTSLAPGGFVAARVENR